MHRDIKWDQGIILYYSDLDQYQKCTVESITTLKIIFIKMAGSIIYVSWPVNIWRKNISGLYFDDKSERWLAYELKIYRSSIHYKKK